MDPLPRGEGALEGGAQVAARDEVQPRGILAHHGQQRGAEMWVPGPVADVLAGLRRDRGPTEHINI